MTDTQHVQTGSCLCGAVRYEISGTFTRFFLCHCSRCRKGTGSAHASNLFAEEADLRWLSGEDQVRVFSVEGTRHSRSFCATCGSPLPLTLPGGRVKVPAGSLESSVEMRPAAHIFIGSRADWDSQLEGVPCFENGPG